MVVGAPSPAESLAAVRISLERTGEARGASWSAEVLGLPGCSATGASPEEAVRRAWAAAEAELGRSGTDDAGETSSTESGARHSGRLLVRMPATLHDELAQAAKSEGVSLNQFITGALASAVEWRASGHERSDQARTPSFTRVLLVANLAVVLLAAAVAVTLLVVWWASS